MNTKQRRALIAAIVLYLSAGATVAGAFYPPLKWAIFCLLSATLAYAILANKKENRTSWSYGFGFAGALAFVLMMEAPKLDPQFIFVVVWLMPGLVLLMIAAVQLIVGMIDKATK